MGGEGGMRGSGRGASGGAGRLPVPDSGPPYPPDPGALAYLLPVVLSGVVLALCLVVGAIHLARASLDAGRVDYGHASRVGAGAGVLLGLDIVLVLLPCRAVLRARLRATRRLAYRANADAFGRLDRHAVVRASGLRGGADGPAPPGARP